MLGRWGKVAGIVAAAGAIFGPLATLPARASRPPAGLAVLSDHIIDGRLHQIVVSSPALGHPTEVRILLPPDYATSTRRYPVLYLLHGAGDTDRSWTTKTDVEALTARLAPSRQMIIVMPDGGRNDTAGWYTNWLAGGPAWESYHIGELLPWVDRSYRTIASRQGRAVAGLSMGGFGAMSYAARHPDLFVAAMSFSGFVDTTAAGPVEALALNELHGSYGTPDSRVWGSYATDEVIWRAHNPADLATNLRGLVLGLWTGDGVPGPGDSAGDAATEAGVHAVNLTFQLRLLSDGIAHTFVDGSGTHAWPYWQADLHKALPLIDQTFAHPPTPPKDFNYRSAEPSFAVWGWRFAAASRRAREFLDLSGVSASGLRATGSGPVRVTTPPIYRPGATYLVTGAGRVVADRSGQLSFAIELGPAHTTQQYTPAADAAQLAAGSEYFRTATVVIAPVH